MSLKIQIRKMNGSQMLEYYEVCFETFDQLNKAYTKIRNKLIVEGEK